MTDLWRGVAWFFRLATHRKGGLGGSRGMLPKKSCIVKASEMPSEMPSSSWEKYQSQRNFTTALIRSAR